MIDPFLRSVNLAKRFGALPVLRQVSIAVAPGEVVGLAAGHGGGKSVLTAILAGVEPPSAGEVYIGGRRMRWPFRARAIGVEVIYQEPELVESLDVTTNLFLGDESGWSPGGRLRVLNQGQMDQRATEVLNQLGVRIGALREPV